MKKYGENYPSDKEILNQHYKQQEWDRYKVRSWRGVVSMCGIEWGEEGEEV